MRVPKKIYNYSWIFESIDVEFYVDDSHIQWSQVYTIPKFYL
jgi:hypothetical protein